MTFGALQVDRRTVLRGLGISALVPALMSGLPACAAPFVDVRLRLATGGTQGVYYAIGVALGQIWQERLGLHSAPQILSTAGSVDNLRLLTSGQADVAFSQVDAAADLQPAPGQGTPCALGRVYDEFLQIVVPRDSPVQTVADLRGKRVSLGAPESGVQVIAKRLVETSGLASGDLTVSDLGINDSLAAFQQGSIDAFFWVGGVPTGGLTTLAAQMPIRLLDLTEALAALRHAYPVYTPGTVPARTYGIEKPVTTVRVRNFLMVDTDMSDDLAYALIEAVFVAQDRLAVVNPLARTIDPRLAIATQPVPLHPGALRYFRDAKDA